MYIDIQTNDYPLSLRDIRKRHPNISFPVPFKSDRYLVVFPTPKPETTVIQRAVEGSPSLTEKGTYEQTWDVVDAFSDYVDSDGNTITKAEQEAEALAAETQRQQLALIHSCEQAVTAHIQSKVDEYNKANNTLFSDVHSCANYAQVDGYTHQPFCAAVWAWNVSVWEIARSILGECIAGTRIAPTVEELINELPVFGG